MSEGIKSIHNEHVSEDSEIVQAHRNDIRDKEVFNFFYEYFRSRNDRANEIKNEIEDIEQASFPETVKEVMIESSNNQLQWLDRDLINFFYKRFDYLDSVDGNFVPGFFLFVWNSLEAGKLPILAKKYGNEPEIRDKVRSFVSDFISRRLDIEIIKEIVELRTRYLEEISRAFIEALPNLLENIEELLIKGVQTGDLPINEDRVRKCLYDPKIVMVDFLLSGKSGAGYHLANSGSTLINVDTRPENYLDVLLHEIVHKLSGKTILSTALKDKAGAETFGITDQRLGLSFTNSITPGNHKLVWLNEAVTEEITCNLIGVETGVYLNERKQLSKLYSLGVSKDALYAAYFEDYDSNDKDRVPAWKKLVQEISKIQPGVPVVQILEDLEKSNNEQS